MHDAGPAPREIAHRLRNHANNVQVQLELLDLLASRGPVASDVLRDRLKRAFAALQALNDTIGTIEEP